MESYRARKNKYRATINMKIKLSLYMDIFRSPTRGHYPTAVKKYSTHVSIIGFPLVDHGSLSVKSLGAGENNQ